MDVRPRIEVEIDELVLHGFPAAQRHAIGDAVIAELERLFAAGTPPPAAHVEHTRADAIRVDAEGGRTGRSIATAVHAAVGRARSGDAS